MQEICRKSVLCVLRLKTKNLFSKDISRQMALVKNYLELENYIGKQEKNTVS